MRALGYLVPRNLRLAAPAIPVSRMDRVQQSRRRRLDDDIEEVFNRACITHNPEAAADLLALMEKWHDRRNATFGRERRISDETLQRARREMARLWPAHAAATARPA